jgi:DNA-binding transcriptional MerR regulator
VNVETLRYYERRGLLPEPARDPSGHRRYDEETVRFLRAIKDAQAVGFTLAEVAEYVRAARRSAAPSEALRVRVAAKIDEIDLRVANLRRMREELARLVGCACDSLDHCTCGAAYLARAGREPVARPPLLHITNGESAGNTLRQTGLGGAVLAWLDVLHEGPVPAVPRPELLQARAAFLSECGWGSRPALVASLERRDEQLVQALTEGRQVVLWFEHDLYDQLQLLDVLALAHEVERIPEMIVVDSFLGQLSADDMARLWPERRAATPAALGDAASAWDAFRTDDPKKLARWARRGSAELPFAGPALERLLEELPDVEGGLSRTERQALEAVAEGARTAGKAFVSAQNREPAAFLGDAWFYRTLAALGRGPMRLVETLDGDELPAPPPLGDGHAFTHVPLRLTEQGESVLRGDGDRVHLLGVDRWIGGTHVTPENDWRWDSADRALVARARRPSGRRRG